LVPLREEFESSGNWLFRWRSYLPLVLVPILVGAMLGFRYPEGSHPLDLMWEGLCVMMSMLGLGVRIATVGFVPHGTSGRNTSEQAASTLNTTGMYSLVRHPLYLGNYLMWLGVAMFPRAWWPPIIVSFLFWVYYERIMFAEEEYLRRKFGSAFTEWASMTPAFIPNPRGFRAPDYTFSTLTVLRREHGSLLAVVASFTVLECAGDFADTGHFMIDPAWAAAFGATVVLWAVLRLAKHRTRLLHATDR
jgi:protein-S-isoprenylcysteine O-methyltransferase Ste14